MFLSRTSIHSCMIIHYIMEENIFFFRYCVHASVTEEILKCYIKVALRLMENKLLKCLKEVNMLNSIILKEK